MQKTFIMNLNKVGELTTSVAGLESMKTHYRRDLEKVLHLIDGSALNLDVEEKPSVIQKIEIIDDILYGVGYIGTAHGAFHIAAYWESDHCTLLSNGKERAIANAMCKIGSDIYVVGQEGNNAVYWKNGKKIALTKSKINPNFASDIASYDNDVYIAGHIFENNIYSAGYWKDGKFTTAISSTNDCFCSGITLHRSKILLSGFIYGNNSIEPFYWTNNELIRLEYPAGYKVYTTGIEVIDNSVYVLGCYETNTKNMHPCYWKDGIFHSLEQKTDSSTIFKVYKEDSALYFVGTCSSATNKSQRKISYWKVSL